MFCFETVKCGPLDNLSIASILVVALLAAFDSCSSALDLARKLADVEGLLDHANIMYAWVKKE